MHFIDFKNNGIRHSLNKVHEKYTVYNGHF